MLKSIMMKSVKLLQKSAFQTLIQDNVNYNLWANETMVNWLQEHSSDKFVQEIPSSFKSIFETLEHIFKVQYFWLKMIQNKPYEFTEDDFSVEELFEKIIRNSIELRDFVCDLDEFELQEKMEIITPWFTSHQPRYELIQQIITHGTYHRGQIVTIGRNVGISNASNTDFNFYLLRGKEMQVM